MAITPAFLCCCGKTGGCALLYRLTPCNNTGGNSSCGWSGPPPFVIYICIGHRCSSGDVVEPGVVVSVMGWCWAVTDPPVGRDSLPPGSLVVPSAHTVLCVPSCADPACSGPNIYFPAKPCRGSAPYLFSRVCYYFCAKGVQEWYEDEIDGGGVYERLCPTAMVQDDNGVWVCVYPDVWAWTSATPSCTIITKQLITHAGCCACMEDADGLNAAKTGCHAEDVPQSTFTFKDKPSGTPRTRVEVFEEIECCCHDGGRVVAESYLEAWQYDTTGHLFQRERESFRWEGLRSELPAVITGDGEIFVDGAGTFQYQFQFSLGLECTYYGTIGGGESSTTDFFRHLTPHQGDVGSQSGNYTSSMTYSVGASCTSMVFNQSYDRISPNQGRLSWVRRGSVVAAKGRKNCESCFRPATAFVPPTGAGVTDGVGLSFADFIR